MYVTHRPRSPMTTPHNLPYTTSFPDETPMSSAKCRLRSRSQRGTRNSIRRNQQQQRDQLLRVGGDLRTSWVKTTPAAGPTRLLDDCVPDILTPLSLALGTRVTVAAAVHFLFHEALALIETTSRQDQRHSLVQIAGESGGTRQSKKRQKRAFGEARPPHSHKRHADVNAIRHSTSR